MPITFNSFTPAAIPAVTELMLALYAEDPSGKPISLEKIQATFAHLQAHPDQGEILVIKDEEQIVGYTILINFWSNEFGGNILTIDELYVVPAKRNQGIATYFLEHLIQTKPHQAVALQLETTPENYRAKALYKRLGFTPHQNEVLVRDL